MKKLTKKQKAVKKLNKIGVYSLNDIDSQKDFDNTKMSRFDWLQKKVGEQAVWIMNDVALMEFMKSKKSKNLR